MKIIANRYLMGIFYSFWATIIVISDALWHWTGLFHESRFDALMVAMTFTLCGFTIGYLYGLWVEKGTNE